MTIKIAFRFGEDRLFARIVRAWQGGDCAHCEVVLYSKDDKPLCFSASYIDGGVRAKSMELPADKWRIYEVPVTFEQASAWLSEHQGLGYDVLGLFGFFFRPLRGQRKKFFCSELAAAVMGLKDPHRYDLALLESVCARFGSRIQ